MNFDLIFNQPEVQVHLFRYAGFDSALLFLRLLRIKDISCSIPVSNLIDQRTIFLSGITKDTIRTYRQINKYGVNGAFFNSILVGYENVVKTLIKLVDVNMEDSNGDCPLTLATRFKRKEIVQLLLKNGAKVDAIGTFGYSALFEAITIGENELVQILLSAGADIHQIAQSGAFSGDNPLTFAAGGNNLSIVATLLANKADVNRPDRSGYTALMMASNFTISQFLLDNGANINAANNNGMTALMFSAEVDSFEVFEFLLKAGADFTLRDQDGLTARVHLEIRCNQLRSDHPDYLQAVKMLDLLKTYENR